MDFTSIGVECTACLPLQAIEEPFAACEMGPTSMNIKQANPFHKNHNIYLFSLKGAVVSYASASIQSI